MSNQILMEPLLAEYATVRSEIQQLNGQIFAVLTSSISLNIAIFGWLVATEDFSKFYVLPTVGIFILFWGNIVLLNRNRLAHRLALFQKYFIESRLPHICWARVYFQYRQTYLKRGLIASVTERLSDSGTYIILATSLFNLVVLIFIGLKPVCTPGPVVLDINQLINFIIAVFFVFFQWLSLWVMTDYKPIDAALRVISKECGLNNLTFAGAAGDSERQKDGLASKSADPEKSGA